jgi:glutamate synthase (NADPH/NADH) small chain
MSKSSADTGLKAGRLDEASLGQNFTDLHPGLSEHEAMVAADRCYFCYDAPCVTACPTAIDIPTFIRQISTGMPIASAKTILEQNILGGMCARVCPTETLCEEACVREFAEGKPVEIGRLQRYSTDVLMEAGLHPFERASPTHKKIAVIGAGPAGLAAAHRLAMFGHDVTILDANTKSGGLNEYGIASYKVKDNIAQKEIEWLMQIGGITVQNDKMLGRDFTLEDLSKDYDAVFLGVGLADVRHLNIKGEHLKNVENAVDFIAGLRQSPKYSDVAVGSNVVVIGGGMTAIDASVQAKLLGAGEVTLVYRKTQSKMPASSYEQDLAKSKGVRIIYEATPKEIKGKSRVEKIIFETQAGNSPLELKADHVLKAIGQVMGDLPKQIKMQNGKIKVDADFKTSVAGVWAGGDCTSLGEDLTVTAVAHGRDAAGNIHATVMGENNG